MQAKIREHLSSIFRKYASCLRTVKKPPKWKKVENTDTLTEEEEKTKKLFRSWFVVGHRNVIKRLERDELRCMMAWSATSPPVLKQALLTLVVSRDCPAALVDDLLLTVQPFWPGLTSLTCLGVLKTSETNDFDELVDFMKLALPKLSFPILPKLSKPIVVQNGNKPNNEGKVENKKSFVKKILALPPKVDHTKFYVLKNANSKPKKDDSSFAGQDFISLNAEPSISEADVIVEDGVTVKNKSKLSELEGQCYGIRPPTSTLTGGVSQHCSSSKRKAMSQDDISAGVKKRMHCDSNDRMSDYVGINVRNLNYDKKKPKVKRDKKIKRIKRNNKTYCVSVTKVVHFSIIKL